MSTEKLFTESIQIPLKLIEELKWSADEYIGALKAYLLERHNVKIPYNIRPEILEKLAKNGWILINESFTDYVCTTKLLELFEQRSKFEEFYSKYPKQVGSRVLAPKDPNSIYGKKMHKKWILITKGNPEMEKQLLKGLELEIEHRQRDGSMEYFQMMESWFNDGTWEKYLSLLKEQESSSQDNLLN